LSLPSLIAAIVSLLTADDAMKAVGWGLLTALPLVAGTLCWGVHIMIAKTHPSLKK